MRRMTRAEIADAIDCDDPGFKVRAEAAAELRKSCAGCWAFGAQADGPEGESLCGQWHPRPDDGTGYCHDWRAK